MSWTSEQVAQREREEALRELELWHSANVIRDAFKRGESEATNLINELKEEQQ